MRKNVSPRGVVVRFYFQVLQEQLIRAERQRILKEFQVGSLPADTVISQDLLEDAEDMDDEDDVRRLRLAADAMQKAKARKTPSQQSSTTATSGGRHRKK